MPRDLHRAEAPLDPQAAPLTTPETTPETAPEAIRRRGLEAWVRALETLSPERLDDLRALATPGVRFADPFVQVEGIEALIGLFRRMFRSLKAVRYHIDDVALSPQAGYLRWTFTCTLGPLGIPVRIAGLSEVGLDADGRVTLHRDTWDSVSELYLKVPVVGPWLRRQIARAMGA